MFVNQKAQELNFKILYLSADATSAASVVSHLHAEGNETGALQTTSIKSFETRLFSFVPSNLGRIKDFAIRLHVFACDGSSPDVLLDPVLAGSNAVVLVAADASALGALKERADAAVARLYAGTWAPPFVALLGDATAEGEPPAGFDAATPFSADATGGAFDSLKAATKACLIRMKQGNEAPKGEEPLTPVLAVNLADVLRRKEAAKGSALTEEEVLAARNDAPFIMLPREKADEFVAQWQSDFINPASPWNAWQALKKDA